MVRLTVDLIARATSGYTKKRTDESIQHFLKRLSHLYLEDRSIDEIGDDLAACRNLIVLYLYDNKLTRLPNLNGNSNLTHLYLQNNQICQLENLAALTKLVKLYVGGNGITVIEGLEKLEQLQELHVENQHLAPGEKLLFDPRSIVGLSRSLQVLNVSGNGLDSVRELSCLNQLNQFMASDNHLSDLKEMAHLLSSWRCLWRLDLIGNPLCHKAKYRDRIIIIASSLEILDGKEITETAKKFLHNWQTNKEAMKRESRDLPPVSGGIVQRASANAQIPGYIMPALPRKQFQEVLARSASQPTSAQVGAGRTPHNGHAVSDIVAGARYRNTVGTVYHENSTMGAPSAVHRSNVPSNTDLSLHHGHSLGGLSDSAAMHRTHLVNIGSDYGLH